jgi:uncharacterized Tic20 family protein
MLAHLCPCANFFFPLAGLIGAILIYSLRRHDLPVCVDNARNAVNALATQALFNLVVFVAGIAVFASLFATIGSGEHGHASKEVPWQFFAYFLAFFVIALSVFGLAVVGAFGARAAWLGRVFRYPLAIPFVRETAIRT